MKKKSIEKGKWSYDHSLDIYSSEKLNREYEQSIRVENIVLDIDKKGSIVGIEIFEASKFFGISKQHFKDLLAGKFEFFLSEDHKFLKIKIDVVFKVRNAERQRIKLGETFADDVLSEVKLQNSNFSVEA